MKVVWTVEITTIVIYCVIGLVGYFAYKSETGTLVILNLSMNKNVVKIIYLFYTIIILLTFPLENFMSLKIMEDTSFMKNKLKIKKGYRRFVFRLFLTLFYLII